MNIAEFRQQYPQYNAIPDGQLAERLYQKHYAGKISQDEFNSKFLGAPVPAEVQKEGFFDRLGREIKDGLVGGITISKAMAQGLPGIGTWTDELAGQAISAVHGGDAEQARKDYMAPVEAMPAGRRLAAELVGGVVGSAPLAGLGIPAAIAASTGLGAVSGAGAADGSPGSRLIGGAAGGAAGLAGGVLAPVVAGTGASLLNRAANIGRAALGKPTNPFVGRGGAAAQKMLRQSLENADAMGVPPPTTAVPLVAQPAGIPAARGVVAGGQKPAAQVVGAAKRIADDNSALQAAGELYQSKLGIVPLSTATTPEDIAASPTVRSNAIAAILDNKDMRPILAKIGRDVRFEGIEPDNLTFLHQAKAMLAERVRQARKSGKVTETAGRLGALEKRLGDAINAAAPGYKDVSSEYAQAAAARAAEKGAAKVAGADQKFVPVDVQGPGLARLAAEFISGSFPGVQTRAAIASGAHLVGAATKAARGAAARKLAAILTERDPDKIAMALQALRSDLTGKPYRWPIMYQGPNALQALAREE